MVNIEGLSRCQSVCPQCGKSHISVYKMVDDNLNTKLVMGFCPKCNKEWVIADKIEFWEE